jgi:hypothetical protein
MTPFEFGQLMASYTTKQAADPRAMMMGQDGFNRDKLEGDYRRAETRVEDMLDLEEPKFRSRMNHKIMPNLGLGVGSLGALAAGASPVGFNAGRAGMMLGQAAGSAAAGVGDLGIAAEMEPNYSNYLKARNEAQSAGGKVGPKVKHPLPLARGVSNAVDKLNIKLPSASQVSQAMPKLPRRPFVD